MRVIKENIKEKMHKCKYCGSIYAYTTKDIDYDWSPTMRCPVCKGTNIPSMFDKKVNKC